MLPGHWENHRILKMSLSSLWTHSHTHSHTDTHTHTHIHWTAIISANSWSLCLQPGVWPKTDDWESTKCSNEPPRLEGLRWEALSLPRGVLGTPGHSAVKQWLKRLSLTEAPGGQRHEIMSSLSCKSLMGQQWEWCSEKQAITTHVSANSDTQSMLPTQLLEGTPGALTPDWEWKNKDWGFHILREQTTEADLGPSPTRIPARVGGRRRGW